MHRRFSVCLLAAPLLAVLNSASLAVAKPASAEALGTLGAEVERCVAAHDSAGFTRHFDVESFLDRVFRNLPVPNQTFAADMRQGMRQAFVTKLGATFTGLPEGTTLTFIHPREADGRAASRLPASRADRAELLGLRGRNGRGRNATDCRCSLRDDGGDAVADGAAIPPADHAPVGQR